MCICYIYVENNYFFFGQFLGICWGFTWTSEAENQWKAQRIWSGRNMNVYLKKSLQLFDPKILEKELYPVKRCYCSWYIKNSAQS